MPTLYYNYTAFANNATVNLLIRYANTVSGGLFGSLLCLVLFVVTFANIKQSMPLEQSVMVAGFITFVAAIPLWAMGAVSGYVLTLLAVVTGLALYRSM